MWGLILMYWGTVFLMYLSQVYYPVNLQLQSRRSFPWRKPDVFMIAIIIWLTCFSFLRTSYNDTGSYILSFRNAQSVSEGIASGTFIDWTENPWSMLYQSVMRELTANYHIYFFFPAFLSSLAVIRIFKRYSVNPAFSLLIFFSLGTYVLYLAALKQCIAVFFLLMAIPYAVDKKYIRFYLLVLVAIMFHTHAFMFAIVPFLFEKPWSIITWLGLAAVLFVMATYNSTLGAFMNFTQSIGAKLVDESELFDGHQINILRVIVYWIPPLLALVFRDRLFQDSNRIENLFVNMSIVSAFILMIGMVQGANLFGRMAGYFEIMTALALPWMIQKIFTKESASIVTVSACVCYFGYFCYEFGVSKSFGQQYSAISLWQFIKELFA